jgi:hypothetical protein
MTIPKYIIKTTPYEYANGYHWFEILDGNYKGVHFNFSKITVTNDILDFQYNLLTLPANIDEHDVNLKNTIGNILLENIQRGNYELDTER